MYKVCIRCYTYNQSRFIKDALNGFASQQTDFPFVAAIIDDASTDNEPQILKEYFEENFIPEDTETAYREETAFGTVLFGRHITNKNCFFAIVLLKENHFRARKSKLPYLSRWMDGAEYIAVCEGDDYWVDSRKLQKQVVFLDEHNDFTLCFHPVKVLDQKSNHFHEDDLPNVHEYPSIEDLIKQNFIHTPSVVYRNLESIARKKNYVTGSVVGDYPHWLICASEGRLYRMDAPMAVYRSGVGIWSSSQLSYERKVIEWIITLSKVSSVFDNPEHRRLINEEILKFKKSLLLNIQQYQDDAKQARRSKAYRLGASFLRPFKSLKRLFKSHQGKV